MPPPSQILPEAHPRIGSSTGAVCPSRPSGGSPIRTAPPKPDPAPAPARPAGQAGPHRKQNSAAPSPPASLPRRQDSTQTRDSGRSLPALCSGSTAPLTQPALSLSTRPFPPARSVSLPPGRPYCYQYTSFPPALSTKKPPDTAPGRHYASGILYSARIGIKYSLRGKFGRKEVKLRFHIPSFLCVSGSWAQLWHLPAPKSESAHFQRCAERGKRR